MITLHGVGKAYGSHRALEPTDLKIDEGEFLTLLGPSGCGKTTLLRILAGFVEPSEGTVELDGVDITSVPPNDREIGMLFQSYALFPHMTVAENVAFGLKLRRMSRRQVVERVERMLDLVSMTGFAARYPRQLSGGQQQRVALARVLAIQPKVLLLDEPLAALDRLLRIQMQAELTRLVAEVGITTVFVTHDQDEALTMSDRIAVMDKGKVAQLGTPSEIYDFPSSAFVAGFVGKSNILRGELTADEPARFRFAGHLLPAIGAAGEGAATMLVRPEHLSVRPAGDAEGSIPAVVSHAVVSGETVDYAVRLADGTELTVSGHRQRGQQILPAGAEVGVTLDPRTPGWILPERVTS